MGLIQTLDLISKAREPSCIVRAVTTLAIAGKDKHAEPLAKQLWKDSASVLAVLNRSAVAPTMTTDTGITLAKATAALFTAVPTSASARLFSRAGLNLQFALGDGAILLPGMTATPGSFTAQGAPIRVANAATSNVALTPRKCAIVVSYSNELLAQSVPNIEATLGRSLVEAAQATIDSLLFDALPGDTVRPAGLRNGVVAGTASVVADPRIAMERDLSTLMTAVAPVAGAGPVVVVASPAQALRAKVLLGGADISPVEIVGSAGVSDGVLVAVAAEALAIATDSDPRVEVGRENVLHLDDSAPAPINSSGTMAVPVRSAWQTDTSSIRVVVGLSWATRVPGAVASLTGATAW